MPHTTGVSYNRENRDIEVKNVLPDGKRKKNEKKGKKKEKILFIHAIILF